MAYNVKFLKGTASSYAGLASKDVNTFYYIDGKDLYLGNVKLSNGSDLANAVADIAANAEEIGKIKTALGNLTQTKFDALVERMNTAESDINTLKSDVEGLKTTTEDHGTRLASAESTVSGHTASIRGLTSDLDILIEAAATKEALQATDDIAKANQAAIATLNGSGEGSVSAQVAAGIAEVVNNAPEDFDTLKEVADWIANDTTGAAAMQADVAKLKTDVADHEARLTTVEGDIDDLQSRMTTVEGTANKNKEDIAANAGNISANAEAIAKNVEDIGKNATAISTEKTRAEGAEKGLSDRLAIVEEMAGVGGDGSTGSIAQQIADAKTAAVQESKAYTDEQLEASESELRGEITAAQEAAITQAGKNADAKYATKAQGQLADSALQPEDITSGTTNGTIKVEGSDIAVTGLKSAAYQEASAFEVAGAAANAQEAAINSAKAYADGLAKNYDAAGSAAKAESNAITYVDTALTWGTLA